MGQKTNPIGFRLGTSQSPHSIWFAQPKNYSEELQEDQKIRNYIQNYIEKNKKLMVEAIACIEIKKRIDIIQVKIYLVFSNLLKEDKQKRIKEFQLNVKQELNYGNRKPNITIIQIAKPFGHPNILAEFIARQLKDRVGFRKSMKKAIELAKTTETKGIQIQIRGRLPGKTRKRIEWIREGRVPLQTVRAKIDYCSYTVRTTYGAIGIKIWIFVDKE
jgi:small subunit ribosomal protein S3